MIIALEHVRGLLHAVHHAAESLDSVDAIPSVDGTPDALAAALMSPPTDTAARSQASGAGSLFWILLLIILVPCLVFGFFRYFDLGSSSAPAAPKAPTKPRANAAVAGSQQQLGSCSSLSSWSAVGSECASYVPPRGSTSVPGGFRKPSGGKQLSVRSAGSMMDCLAAQKMKSTASARSAGVNSVSGSLSQRGGAARTTTAKPSAKFMVPVDSMMDLGDSGKFNIVDTISGQTLSVVLGQNDQGFRRLQLLTETLAMCASAEPPEGAQGGVSRLELRGPGGLLLGSLAPREDGTMAVHRHGQPQFIIWGNEDALDLEVSTEDGQPTATVSCTQDGSGGAELVEVNIFDGPNVQLVVCCIFAILFLCGEGA